jgi:hypothetical protein
MTVHGDRYLKKLRNRKRLHNKRGTRKPESNAPTYRSTGVFVAGFSKRKAGVDENGNDLWELIPANQ